GHEHFSFLNFYDIEVSNIQKISEEEYKSKAKSLHVFPVKNEILIHHQDESYELFADDIYLTTQKPKPYHEQSDGDELFGYFEDVEVVFKTHKVEKKIICKEGFKT